MLVPLSLHLVVGNSLLLFAVVNYLFVLVEVVGLPVILAGCPVAADNIAYDVLVEHNNLG